MKHFAPLALALVLSAGTASAATFTATISDATLSSDDFSTNISGTFSGTTGYVDGAYQFTEIFEFAFATDALDTFFGDFLVYTLVDEDTVSVGAVDDTYPIGEITPDPDKVVDYTGAVFEIRFSPLDLVDLEGAPGGETFVFGVDLVGGEEVGYLGETSLEESFDAIPLLFGTSVATLTVDGPVAPVPLPASALLLAGAMGGLGALRRRRTAA